LKPDDGAPRWFSWFRTSDGLRLRWEGLAEFSIRDRGRTILGRPLASGWYEAFAHQLLTQVISFALLERGVEHLHSTVVQVDDVAVAFTAAPGAGKSTLAAGFVRAGHRLVTDDVLVLRTSRGRLMAQPGYPRMRLVEEAAERVVPDLAASAVPHPLGTKRVVAVPAASWASDPIPLARIYELSPGARSVRLGTLQGRRAFRTLAENTYNALITDARRLERHLTYTASLAGAVPVKRLSYPKEFGVLDVLRRRVLDDLA
jgi:hypothetical protein